MTTRRRVLQTAAVAAVAGPAWRGARAEGPPSAIRIGIATGGIGNPIRHGGSSLALVRAHGALEREFAAGGTRIEWIFFKGAGPAVNEALVNRQLDLAWQGDLPSIVHRAAGVATRIVAGVGVRAGLFLGVPTGSALQGLDELRGKRVAVFKGTNLHLSALRALAARGLKESDVRFINLDPAAALAALGSRDIDAAFGYVELFMLRDQGGCKVVWSAAADSVRYTRQAALLATESFAAAQPRALERIVRVVAEQAHEYSDEKRRGELFAEWGQAELAEPYWREDFIGQPLRTRLSPLLDPFLVARYKEAAAEAYRLKLIRSQPEIETWFDRRFLDAALKQLKLEDHWPAYAAYAADATLPAGPPVARG